MALTWWPSPAKLNLFLHINQQREDGYHCLQTVFQMLDRGDEIAFEPAERLHMATPMSGVCDEDNLILKAARLLQDYTNTQLGCRIHINKNLPMGGGVGGGSSNAATTLLVLNKLWNLTIPSEELQQLGLSLGADVPVFVNGETTFAEGVGESFTPIAIPESWYLIVHPNIHVSTQTIFTEPDLPRSTPIISPKQYKFESTQNDCQKIVCNRHPEVAYLLQWLIQFAPSRMTGTGACVFAQFNAKHEAEETLAKLPRKWSGFVAKGVQTSPLIQQLESQRSYTF
ncbi:4-(cytidine 5'-diphospho)-2-C-methyl-D-erythritol kinase [Alteromonas sp. 5E99-2]|uniref:4-(cytidine 5'-diphospho)-2-C-methyl-D-erythritol kinase n=1 Tax=Alteromonas sp. 5E99-2 TaxID=2817683 RepID=UPI001A985D6F|nr:4-(cytidine 5'-diphospho)-2-C-methyl-D-erythritol kinase [Alteromonas sp. 5E99-2]MBO1255490.1 4-(cytidine 5'-diphospho)-2-C-methyl-D-erythritol kinase [Alteromonas sp. 5E99-2]